MLASIVAAHRFLTVSKSNIWRIHSAIPMYLNAYLLQLGKE